MADETREGGCACGELRYRVQGEPMIVHACHCSDCQTESGTAFALNAMYEAERVSRLSGEGETVSTPSASGKGQDIVRCPRCHVAVWSHYAGAGRRACFVRVGTLDAPDLTPDIHVFTRSKRAWLTLPDGALAFDAYYKPAEVWPEAARDRWRAMMSLPEPAAD